MEFHGDWTLLDMEDFETASSPRDPGALGVDVLVSKAARLPTARSFAVLGYRSGTRQEDGTLPTVPARHLYLLGRKTYPIGVSSHS